MNVKKEALKLLIGIAYIIGFIALIRYFTLGFWGIYGLILGFSAIQTGIRWRFKKEAPTIKSFIKSAIMILLFMVFIRWIANIGGIGSFWGFIISVLVISALILIIRRKKFVETKHHIEAMVWGKPLKEYITEGQKPPKIKIVGSKAKTPQRDRVI